MKSLLQMVQELQRRVAFLETEIAAIRSVAPKELTPGLDAYAQEYERKFAAVIQQMMDNAALSSKPLDMAKVEQNVKQITRAMCPKCGVKPNHFFHVKSCQGQQKEQKNGEDAIRRRDQSKA